MIDIQQMAASGELFDGHYKLLRTLSTDGATADVWLARDVNTIDADYGEDAKEREEETGILVAIKIYRPKNALDIEGEQRFRDEFKIVYECRHANLLQPTSFSIYEECPYLVLPYCKNGSSEQLIGKTLKEWEIWKFIQDVAAGLNRLHANNPQIVHQDIKPANILVDNDRNYAITDFGISSKRGGVHGYYYDEENSGTLAYMAPERFVSGSDPMPESDVWAFGATLCEILTGQVPFGEEGGMAQVERKLSMPAMHGVPAPVQRLICACLDKEPGNRPTAQQILAAARTRQFPPPKRTWMYITLSVIVALLVGVGVWRNSSYYFEHEYKLASDALMSNNLETFRSGYEKMMMLCRKEYIPAMYDLASIHGWNHSKESLRKKQMLKIEVDEEDFPILQVNNSKAMNWLQAILNKANPQYAIINSKAALLLAQYSLNDNAWMKANYHNGEDYLNLSLKWAEQSQDEGWIMEVQNIINTFKINLTLINEKDDN